MSERQPAFSSPEDIQNSMGDWSVPKEGEFQQYPDSILEAVEKGQYRDRIIIAKLGGRLSGTLSLDHGADNHEWFNAGDLYGISDLVESGDTIRIVKDAEDEVVGIIHKDSLIWQK